MFCKAESLKHFMHHCITWSIVKYKTIDSKQTKNTKREPENIKKTDNICVCDIYISVDFQSDEIREVLKNTHYKRSV